MTKELLDLLTSGGVIASVAMSGAALTLQWRAQRREARRCVNPFYSLKPDGEVGVAAPPPGDLDALFRGARAALLDFHPTSGPAAMAASSRPQGVFNLSAIRAGALDGASQTSPVRPLVDGRWPRRSDQEASAGLVYRLADLIDLLEHGGTGRAVIGDARQLHRDIAQHLGVGLDRDALGPDVGGDGRAEGQHPGLQSHEAHVGLGQRATVFIVECGVQVISSLLALTLIRVLRRRQP